jgi:predicted nucleic acid-binding protein
MAALHGRILSFNASVTHVWAEQQRELERADRHMPIEDSYIAATTSPSSPATTNTFADPA